VSKETIINQLESYNNDFQNNILKSGGEQSEFQSQLHELSMDFIETYFICNQSFSALEKTSKRSIEFKIEKESILKAAEKTTADSIELFDLIKKGIEIIKEHSAYMLEQKNELNMLEKTSSEYIVEMKEKTTAFMDSANR
jgi:hypothetical protein